MAIIEKYDYSMFEVRFRDYGRLDHFPKGLRELYGYLDNLSDDMGKDIELDVIALCCDFSEIAIKDIEQETGCAGLEELRDNTIVIDVDDETVIYGSF